MIDTNAYKHVMGSFPSGVTVTHIGVCSASSGATVLDRISITSQNFSAQGTLQVNFTYTQS